jgi:hypothetical protein
MSTAPVTVIVPCDAEEFARRRVRDLERVWRRGLVSEAEGSGEVVESDTFRSTSSSLSSSSSSSKSSPACENIFVN